MQSHEQQMVRVYFNIRILCENTSTIKFIWMMIYKTLLESMKGEESFLLWFLMMLFRLHIFFRLDWSVCAYMYFDTIGLYISNIVAGHFAARWWSPKCNNDDRNSFENNVLFCLNWDFSACSSNLLVKISFYSSSRTVVVLRCFKRFTVSLVEDMKNASNYQPQRFYCSGN